MKRVTYFVAASVWNIAVIGIACFLASWLLDIVGAVVGSGELRGFAYGVGLLSTVMAVWSVALAAILASILRCDSCGSRILTVRSPYLVPLTSRGCPRCGQKARAASEPKG
jgi:DNA-directed RNA polymerase subunit RPC12/RpoP